MGGVFFQVLGGKVPIPMKWNPRISLYAMSMNAMYAKVKVP